MELAVDDAMRAQLVAVQPYVLRYMRERLLPQQISWSIQVVVYAVFSATGVYAYGWSPALVLLSFVLGLATTLAAETLGLLRLHRSGYVSLLNATDVMAFASSLLNACNASSSPKLQRRMTLDYMSEQASKTQPARAAAGISALFFFLGSLMLLPALWGLSTQADDSSVLSVVLLAAANLLHGASVFSQRLTPPLEGAPWTIEFYPIVRGFGYFMVGMFLLAMAMDASPLRPLVGADEVLVLLGALGAWGVISLISSLSWTPKLID